MGKLTQYVAYINGDLSFHSQKHHLTHFTVDSAAKKTRKLLKIETSEQILDKFPVLDGVLISDHERKAVHLAMKEYARQALENARSRIHGCLSIEFAQYEIEKIKLELK